jgi:hypothetical protein
MAKKSSTWKKYRTLIVEADANSDYDELPYIEGRLLNSKKLTASEKVSLAKKIQRLGKYYR